MSPVPHEPPVLARSLWSDTANPAPDRPALRGEVTADCVVIGAGFTGLSAALHLAEAGREVVVLEAFTPGWGASGRNGGQVNPGLKDGPGALAREFGDDLGGRMARLSGESADLVFDLIARHDITCEASRTGWIRAAHGPKALAGLRALAAEWQALGAPVETLDAAEIATLLGTDHYHGGIIDRRGGSLHPLNYALGLAGAAERAGARLHGDSPVVGIETGRELVTVRTAEARVRARQALVCTNAYTGDLAAPLGRSLLPVTSVQVATAPLSGNLAASILPRGQAVSDTRRLLLYFRKDAAGRFIIGGRGATAERTIRACQEDLRRKALRLFPQLDGVAWTHAWGGSVALTRSHLPGLHEVAPGVLAGLGYNGRGIGMATVMGRLLALRVTGARPEDLDFPITPPQPQPLLGLRRALLAPALGAFRFLDRIGA